MKKLKKVLTRLTWIDAILWATPIAIIFCASALTSCSKIEELPTYKVIINSGTLQPNC